MEESYGESGYSEVTSVIQASDGHYVMCGVTYCFNDTRCFWLVSSQKKEDVGSMTGMVPYLQNQTANSPIDNGSESVVVITGYRY